MKLPVPFKTESTALFLMGLCTTLITIFNQNANAQCAPPFGVQELSINNIRASIFNGGDMWWDGIGSPKYEYPKGSGINALFAGGIWLSAVDDSGILQTAAMQYRSTGHDFYPGPISANGAVTAASCSSFDRFWKVSSTQVQQHIIITSSGTPISTNNISNDILLWPAKGNTHFTLYAIQEELAPFVDVNNNGIYDPEYGDYPHIKGDEAIFWVMNDVGGLHTSSYGAPIGVEIHALAYSFSDPTSALHETTFYEFSIIKKATGTANNFYFGLFVDPDLGYSLDDYVGCDTITHSAYVYNGDGFDETQGPITGYGTTPPIVSTTFLNQPMNSFLSFNNSTSVTGTPQQAMHYRNYMSGLWKDGSPVTEGGNGYGGATPTHYMYHSNPTASAPAWTESTVQNTPGDRRYVQSSGPYTLNHMDKFEITYATIAHPTAGDNNINNMVLPRINDVRQAFNDSIANGNTYFNPLNVAELDHSIVQLQPNPVSSVLTIKLQKTRNANIRLIDVNGREVYSINNVHNPVHTVNMAHLENGIYFLQVITNNGSSTHKLIKNNAH